MTVYNLINSNGNSVANQFVIEDGDCIAFQSYRSRVCEIKNGVVTLGRHWDYSKTTMKHLNEFLRQNGFYNLIGAKAIREAIKNGEAIYNEALI